MCFCLGVASFSCMGHVSRSLDSVQASTIITSTTFPVLCFWMYVEPPLSGWYSRCTCTPRWRSQQEPVGSCPLVGNHHGTTCHLSGIDFHVSHHTIGGDQGLLSKASCRIYEKNPFSLRYSCARSTDTPWRRFPHRTSNEC